MAQAGNRNGSFAFLARPIRNPICCVSDIPIFIGASQPAAFMRAGWLRALAFHPPLKTIGAGGGGALLSINQRGQQ
jgi:hypothetical protein